VPVPRPPVLLVVLSACAGVKHDDALGTDSDDQAVDSEAVYRPHTGVDTALDDTAPEIEPDTDPVDTGDGYFRPTQISYVAELAVDATPALHDFGVLRTPYVSYFAVEMSDGVAVCRIDYQLDPAAFGWTGQEGIDPDLDAFLGANGQLFGFRVTPGLYTATTSAACDDLPPGITTDLPADALTLFTPGADPLILVGIDQAPEPDVTTALLRSFSSWVAEDQVLGGRMEFPFSFGITGGGTSNQFSNGGVMGVVDEAFEVQLAGSGFQLHPRTDAWTGTQPGVGYYWVIPVSGFTISWTP
jgi:hypothetical protein